MGFKETEKQLRDFPEMIRQGWAAGGQVEVLDKFSRVLVCGMGGSGIPGDLLCSYLNGQIPVVTVKDYALPNFLDKHTLAFIVSYSGNTEETLSCFRGCLGLGCRIIGVTSGGKLKELCEKHKLDCMEVPKGLQPRHALPLLFFSMLRVLSNSRVIEDQSAIVEKTIEAVSKGNFTEMGKAMAEKLKDRIPLIYSSEVFRWVAYRWKTQINENAKSMAFCHVFPELNHNELVGFEQNAASYHVVMLQDESDNPRIKKRMKVTKQLLQERGAGTTLLVVKGSSMLSKLFSAVYMGDWVSLFLAEHYGVDPTPVDIVEEFKRQL